MYRHTGINPKELHFNSINTMGGTSKQNSKFTQLFVFRRLYHGPSIICELFSSTNSNENTRDPNVDRVSSTV